MSPTERSLQQARRQGYVVAIVERWNPFAKVRHDLFGFGDLLCMKAGEPLLLIQTTTTAHLSERFAKLAALPTPALWLSTGNQVELWGWALRKPRGERKRWALTVRPIRRTLVTDRHGPRYHLTMGEHAS